MNAYVVVICLLLVIFGSIGGYLYQRFSAFADMDFTPPPVTVAVSTAALESWDETLNAVGTVQAVRGIQLISVPLSIFGALVPLALGIATLNIYTQVGLLTLIGLISKHGILIVDFANHRIVDGAARRAAVLEAAGLRLRPILMTTFATVLGVVPLLTAFGAGANSRFAIGLMIAAGMMVGTLFTLFVLPTFYLFMGRSNPTTANETAPLSIDTA